MNHDAYSIGPHRAVPCLHLPLQSRIMWLVLQYRTQIPACGPDDSAYTLVAPTRDSDLRTGYCIRYRAVTVSIRLPGFKSGLANGKSCRGCQNRRSAGIAYFGCTLVHERSIVSFYSIKMEKRVGVPAGEGTTAFSIFRRSSTARRLVSRYSNY
jgi:hypothetical protein